MPLKKTPTSGWAFLTVMAVLAVLFLGLYPKGLPSKNPVRLDTEHCVVTFERYGIAFAELDRPDPVHTKAVTIEMAVRAADVDKAGFKSLLMVHDGDDRKQLIIGQWKTSVIIMNGDDYDNRRKFPKLSVKDVFNTENVRFITIVAGDGSTRLYLDGKHVRTNPRWRLTLPVKGDNVTMIVANSVTGKQSWTGELFGLSLYGCPLSPAKVKSHYARWAKDHRFFSDTADEPLVRYTFCKMAEHNQDHPSLQIPVSPTVLEKRYLSFPWVDFKANRSFFMDALFNWLGFVPLGAFLFAWLRASNRVPGQYCFFTTVLFCFFLSLGIEMTQAWMPTRSSSLLDLFLNTMGAWTGIWLMMKDILTFLPFTGQNSDL